MRIVKYAVGMFFLASLSVAYAGTHDRDASDDRVEVSHAESLEVDHPEDVNERPEVDDRPEFDHVDHPEMAEVEHDHASGAGSRD